MVGNDKYLRFLAQPQHDYKIYSLSDRRVDIQASESGNLSLDEGVVRLPEYIAQINPLYVPADIDKDGVRDLLDNCVRLANPNQDDIDRNGRGDACDDFDRDGLVNSVDNCVNQPNRNQTDEDADGIGDVCDDEESRFTERNTWVPWVGMGTAAAVMIFLFALVAKGPKPEVVNGSSDE